MGQQNHSFPFTGRVDTLTFFQTKDGKHMVKKKKRAGGAVFATDEGYQIVKRNRDEFARATKAGRLIREALRKPLSGFRDKTGTGRMSKTTLAVVKSDSINPRGERNMMDGDFSILEGYEFNPRSQLKQIIVPNIQTNIDRVTGKLTATIPSLTAKQGDLRWPKGSSHFKILAVGLELDFEFDKVVYDQQYSGLLPIDENPTNPLVLECSITPNSLSVLMVVVGVEFYSDVNGYTLPVENGAFSALKIVGIDNQ